MNANKKKKRKKKTALVVCQDRKQFWTTQTQFWQWVRDGIVVKTGEQPLTGLFKREHEELIQTAADAGAGVIVRGGVARGEVDSHLCWHWTYPPVLGAGPFARCPPI